MSASGNYIVESDIDNWADSISSTETFATTAVDIATNRITVANDIATGSLLKFSSTGEVPASLVTGTAYYAIRINGTTIQVATTPVTAAAGTAIDLTDVGAGTHTLDVGEGSSTVDRQAVITRVENWIEGITDDFFYAKDFVIYRDGNNNDRLSLGLIPDILSVSEISIAGVVLEASWWTYDVNSVYLDPEAVSAEAGDMAELHLRLKYKRTLFPRGLGNIKVTGTYGWSSCPDAIKQATIVLCKANNDSTLYTTYGGSLKSEKLGDYSYTLAEGSSKKTTGIDEVDKLLSEYIRRKPMMGAV